MRRATTRSTQTAPCRRRRATSRAPSSPRWPTHAPAACPIRTRSSSGRVRNEPSSRELLTMMYSCAPAARGGSAAVVKKKGKSLRVDIHCHYLNTEVAARVAGKTPPESDYLVKFSNELTRQTNASQG